MRAQYSRDSVSQENTLKDYDSRPPSTPGWHKGREPAVETLFASLCSRIPLALIEAQALESLLGRRECGKDSLRLEFNDRCFSQIKGEWRRRFFNFWIFFVGNPLTLSMRDQFCVARLAEFFGAPLDMRAEWIESIFLSQGSIGIATGDDTIDQAAAQTRKGYSRVGYASRTADRGSEGRNCSGDLYAELCRSAAR